MLKLNLKQTLITLILIVSLLAALAVGILKLEAVRNAPANLRGSHALAWYCPPPPLPC